jgi:hypothetical protein
VKANDPPETWKHHPSRLPQSVPKQPSHPPPFNVFPGPQVIQPKAAAAGPSQPSHPPPLNVLPGPPAKAIVDKNAGQIFPLPAKAQPYAPGQQPIRYKWSNPAKEGRSRYLPGYPKQPMAGHPGTLAPVSPAKACVPAPPPPSPVPATPSDQDWGPGWPAPACPAAAPAFPPQPPPAASFPSPSTFADRWRAISELPTEQFQVEVAALRAEAS